MNRGASTSGVPQLTAGAPENRPPGPEGHGRSEHPAGPGGRAGIHARTALLTSQQHLQQVSKRRRPGLFQTNKS